VIFTAVVKNTALIYLIIFFSVGQQFHHCSHVNGATFAWYLGNDRTGLARGNNYMFNSLASVACLCECRVMISVFWCDDNAGEFIVPWTLGNMSKVDIDYVFITY